MRCAVGDTLNFQVFDEERGGKDDIIGSGSWKVVNQKEKESKAWALRYKTEGVGKIEVAVQFLEDGVPVVNSYATKIKEADKLARQEKMKEESKRQMALEKKEMKELKKDSKKDKDGTVKLSP